MSALVTELDFRVVTTEGNPLSESESTTTESHLRVLVGPTVLVLALEDRTRIIDFTAQSTLILDHVAHTRERVPMFAFVHDRVAGYWSAIHVLEALAAGGSVAFGTRWQVQAAYGLRGSEEVGAEPERSDSSNAGSAWTIDGAEIARFEPSEVALDRRSLTRVLAYAAHLYPEVAVALVAEGRVPALLRTQNHFPATNVDQTLTLVGHREGVEFDGAREAEAYAEASASDPIRALVGRALDGPRPDHVAAARAAFANEQFVAAQLACCAHTVSVLDTQPAQQLLGEITNVTAGWWRLGQARSAQRLFSTIEMTRDPKTALAKVAGLNKLRPVAGPYAYMLDVFIGEHRLETMDLEEATASLSRALEVDPYLVGAWISLGRTLNRRLMFDRGWQCWDRALRQCPQHPIADAALGWCRKLQADYPEFF